VPATVTGFGAVSQTLTSRMERAEQEERKPGASTLIEYFGADGRCVQQFVPASPGDASLSFFGIVFDEPLIARCGSRRRWRRARMMIRTRHRDDG
jgi:hypothetical protein